MTKRHLIIAVCIGFGLLLGACRPTAVPTLFPTITPSQPQRTATSIKPQEVTATPKPTPSITPAATIPAPLPLSNVLAVSFVDASNGWLLGDACTQDDTKCLNRVIVLRHSTDGGRTWAPLPAPHAFSPDSAEHPLERVSSILFSSATDGWLYGPNTFYTHDGGQTWLKAPQAILALAFQDNLLWAIIAADDSWQVATSSDNGGAWVSASTQPAWAGGTPQLAALNAKQAWVMANTDFDWYLWHTADGGQSWKEMPETSQPFRAVRLLEVDQEGRLWLFSADQPAGGSQSKSLYTSTDAGASWQLVAVPPYDSRTPCSLPWSGELPAAARSAATNGSEWFLVLSRYTLVGSANAGCNWSEAVPFAQANIGDATIIGVTFADSRHGWAAASPNRLFITNDGGITWEMIAIQ